MDNREHDSLNTKSYEWRSIQLVHNKLKKIRIAYHYPFLVFLFQCLKEICCVKFRFVV